MQISVARIKEFQRIFKVRFGRELTAEEAREMGANLAQLVQLVYRPIRNPRRRTIKQLKKPPK